MYRRLVYLSGLILVLGLIPAGTARAELRAWWKFDEGAGTAVADATGNGHDGTINGNPTWAAGTYGGALNFDGSGDYVMCDLLDIDTSVTGGLTVCGWINRPTGGDRKLCSNRQAANAAGGGFTCTIYNERMEMDLSNATARALARDGGGPAFPTDTWVFVAYVFDDAGDLFKEYQNNVMVDSDAVTISVGVSTSPFRIGGDSPAVGLYYLGMMDDWRVYDHALTEDELQDAMAGRGPNAELASEPTPADAATDVVRDVVLSWLPSELAATHDVYFGTAFDAVDAADRGNPGDVLVSQGQTGAEYQPPVRLEFGQTYYWRVDEVNAAPDNTIFKGSVWSFTVEPVSYVVENVTATASGSSTADMGPGRTVDGSGLVDGAHGTSGGDMWLSNNGAPGTVWIQYAFEMPYKLDKMVVWNSNQAIEAFLGFGAKSITIDYSLDGESWSSVGDVELAQAPGTDSYAPAGAVDLAGAVAQYVRLTMNSNWGGMVQQYGLSEVRFYSIPVVAREPDPADGAAEIGPEPTLSWRAGREADTHRVFVSTDEQAVIDGTAPAETVAAAQYTPVLDLDATYFWKVVEVNDAETPTAWEGPVWSFATQAALAVDDFESYTDDEGSRIYEAWIDGWEVATNGSLVGYGQAPFAERTIVNSGGQSMPFAYDNAGATYAEATRTFDSAQDWTKYGLQTLSLMFYGAPDNAGTLYVKINNTKVTYTGSAADLKRAQWQVWNIDLAATGASLANVTKLSIGVDGAGVSGLLFIDDIRLYPKPGAVVTPVDPGTAGLLAWYKFDGNFNDAMGKFNASAVAGATTGADATRGQVLTLTIAGQAVNVPALGTTDALTIAMWANSSVDPLPLQFESFFHSNGWAPGDLHWRYSYGKVNGGINGVTGDLTGSALVTANQWNHVAVTVSPTEWALWLNGMKEASLALTAPVTVTFGDGLIGAWLGTDNVTVNRGFTGAIDDARFYNRALSQEEIASLAGRTEPFGKPF